jgi:hypothetical protein
LSWEVIAGVTAASIVLLIVVIVGGRLMCRWCRRSRDNERKTSGSERSAIFESLKLAEFDLLDWTDLAIGKRSDENMDD